MSDRETYLGRLTRVSSRGGRGQGGGCLYIMPAPILFAVASWLGGREGGGC